jgi:hypothetical protein
MVVRKTTMVERSRKQAKEAQESFAIQSKMAWNWASGKNASEKRKKFDAGTWQTRISALEEMGSPRVSEPAKDMALEDVENGGLNVGGTGIGNKRLSSSTACSTGEAERSKAEKDSRKQEQKELQELRSNEFSDLDSYLASPRIQAKLEADAKGHAGTTSPRSASPSSSNQRSTSPKMKQAATGAAGPVNLKQAAQSALKPGDPKNAAKQDPNAPNAPKAQTTKPGAPKPENPNSTVQRQKLKRPDAGKNPFESSEELNVINKKKPAPPPKNLAVSSSSSSSSSSDSD